MKYILFSDEEHRFINNDGAWGYGYTGLPWNALKFDTPEQAREFQKKHFPCEAFTILGLTEA